MGSNCMNEDGLMKSLVRDGMLEMKEDYTKTHDTITMSDRNT